MTPSESTTNAMTSQAYDANAEFDRTHWWFLGRNGIIRTVVARFACRNKTRQLSELSVIDYGCGTGGVSESLKHNFGAYYCFEPTPEGAGVCRARGLQVYDTIAKLRYAVPGGSDLLLLLDVLEHLEDDASFLKEACGYLNSSGLCIITVPAYEWLWGGEDVVSRHVRRYTRKSLRAVVESSGQELVYLSAFNTFLLPLQIAAVLASRNLYPKETMSGKVTNLKRSGRLQQIVCLGILKIEAWLLKKVSLPAGGSLIAVVRPRNTNENT